MQRKHQSKIRADADDRVIGEDKLRLRVYLFLGDIEGIPWTDHILSGEVDIHFFRVDNVGALLDLLQDVDGAFGEVVEGVDLLEGVGVHLEVVGRVNGQQLGVVQADWLQLYARSPRNKPIYIIQYPTLLERCDRTALYLVIFYSLVGVALAVLEEIINFAHRHLLPRYHRQKLPNPPHKGREAQ